MDREGDVFRVGDNDLLPWDAVGVPRARGVMGNYRDVDTGLEYWISNPK
jgi:hypothetical protein